jgi:hypothetical protein
MSPGNPNAILESCPWTDLNLPRSSNVAQYATKKLVQGANAYPKRGICSDQISPNPHLERKAFWHAAP